MSERFTCSLGHQWEARGTPSATETADANCPVCMSLFKTPPLPADQAPSPNLDQVLGLLPDQNRVAVTRTGPPVVLASPASVSPPGYEILGELGRGGMGIVYKARQVQLDRLVALKMILAGGLAGSAERDRFRTEAEAIARLQHPNIVQVYEVGEHDGKPFFSLEFCSGGSLQQKLNGAPLPPLEAAQLVQTLAHAVQAAHERSVIHRDLKPANVLLASDGTPKITDFGLAKKLDDVGQTASGAVMGTPSYMAPEQAAGRVKDVGPAADVYALGAILYELLTGRPPFRGETPMDTLVQVLGWEPAPPRRLQPKVPRDLEVVCLKCLEKEPARRYPSALALAEELRRFLAHEPIQARPLSAPARLWRWCRRKPALAAATGLAAAALAAVVVLSVRFGLAQSRTAGELREALDDAVTNRKSAQRLSARLALDRGIALCEEGEIARGLLWLARSLETAATAGADDLEPAIRANLAAWRRHLCLPRARLEHRTMVSDAAFSPDGKLVLTGDLESKAHLWDADTGRVVDEPIAIPASPDAGMLLVAFKPDGATFLTASWRTGKVHFWDTKTRRQMGPPLEPSGEVAAVAFNPDGKLLLTGGHNGTAQLWDADAHKALGAPLAAGKGRVRAVAFHPDGKTCATGCEDGTVRFWDAATRQPSGLALVHRGPISGLAFRPDGKVLLTGSQDGFARLWDVATGKLLREVEAVHGRPLGVAAVAFSPDGQTFLTGDFDHHARLWDAASGVSRGALQHGSTVRAVAFSPDGRTVVTASNDRTARVWNVPPGTRADRVLAHPSPVLAVACSPDGRLLATGCKDRVVRLWDATTGRRVRDLTGHTGWVEGVAFSPTVGRADAGGRLLASAGYEGTVRLWDVETGKQQGKAWDQRGAVFAVAFSPNGRTVLVGGDKTAQQLGKTAGESGPVLRHGQLVHGVAFSPDGLLLATGSADFTARLWDADTDAFRLGLQHPAVVSTVAFSPDGRTLLTGCADNLARFWDLAEARVVGRPLAHGGWVLAVAFGRDGRLAATAGGFTARLWDAVTRYPIGPVLQHESFVNAVAFSPDGRTVLTGSDDRTARLWPAPVPLAGGVEQLVAWVQVATGLELDAEGVVHELDDAAREQRRQRLQELGGPPG
jgi:eukaryotic-like serine/threonine-protein kinase